VVDDWIFDENLGLFMEALAHFAARVTSAACPDQVEP
jgi:hypothetical protein